MLAPVRVAAPASLPVTLEQAKSYLRVDHSDDDALITALIESATDYLDGWSGILGRALITQTWRADFDHFPRWDTLRLPIGPLQSIASIVYSDGANADQTVPGADYVPLTDPLGPNIALASGKAWPSTFARGDAVRVTFVAGMGDGAAWAAGSVPGMAAVKTAIMMMVQKAYSQAQRDPSLVRDTVEGIGSQQWAPEMAAAMDQTIDRLLSPLRALRL